MSWITPHQPALVLAPMEGVTDAPMRALLSERGGFQFCVSEFLRINHLVPPAHVYLRHVPELTTGGKTPSGLPVQVQILGGSEDVMAESALRACELGAGAIDINFGCPAPTVNRHDGGASLLRFPDRIRRIVAAVRKAVPSPIPVSAKLRLGWDNKDDIFINAEQARLGGASWITIHARTRTQGYAPPAYWSHIGEVKRRLDIPVVANGEIWTVEDFLKCWEESGCIHFMLGRGALADPSLVHRIADRLGIGYLAPGDFETFASDPTSWRPLLARFSSIVSGADHRPGYLVRRAKQWLKFGHIKHSIPWFDGVKRAETFEELMSLLR